MTAPDRAAVEALVSFLRGEWPDGRVWSDDLEGDVADLLLALLARAERAEAAARALMRAMRVWGAQEDGIPYWPTDPANPWAAYQEAEKLLAAPAAGEPQR